LKQRERRKEKRMDEKRETKRENERGAMIRKELGQGW
jgi:hypothetical protein